MSAYLYFSNNLYRPYIGLYDKLQNLFPVNGSSFKRKPKLIATPYFTVVLGFKQYLFQNNLQRTGLEPC